MRNITFKSFIALLMTNRNLALEEHFLLTEIFMALEKTGFNGYATAHPEISIVRAASELGLRNDLLEAVCEFLAEKSILHKVGQGIFRKSDDYAATQGPIYFLLAYKSICESLAELLTGSKIYGKDIVRDARYLGTGTKLIFPLLAKIFKARGIKSVLDLGCGNGAFLLTLAAILPDFRGIGIEIDKPTINEAEASILASPYKNSIGIFHGDAGHPESFPVQTDPAEAIIGIGMFHEFRKDGTLVPILNRYKARFPRSRLFLVEFDTPDWDELRQRPQTPERKSASIYRFLHYFSEQGLPQSKSDWVRTINSSEWKIDAIHDGPNRLVAFECR